MIRDIGYLEILKTNPGTSIQDLGRIGLGHWGIPISGAQDQRSFNLVNHLLKNKPNAAVLEIFQPGFKCSFDSYATIGLAGAKAEIRKNGALNSSTLIIIKPGDEVEIGKFCLGSIVYLGIALGFQTMPVLESRSFYPRITHSSMLTKGEKIPFFTNQAHPKETYSTVKMDLNWLEEELLEVFPGPDFEALSEESKTELFHKSFTISTLANRMAFQVEELLPNQIPEQMTAAAYPGTVQLTSGGKLLILMRDAQVTGGYPRILQLAASSISLLAQKKPRQKVRFHLNSLEVGL
jgi:biotin-dependent carboxylase-like uncharacterized protein